MAKEPVRIQAGIRVSHRATWISLFRGKRQHDGQGSEIQESWANQSCRRNPALWGRQRTLRMMTRPLGESSAGTNAGHGGGHFFIWWSAALRMRGSSRKFDHLARVRYSLPGVDPSQGDVGTRACATTANRTPSIQMQLGCSSHTLKRCLAQRTQRICERRSTLLKGAGGKLPSLAPPTQLP
jgi:hypothetical protein